MGLAGRLTTPTLSNAFSGPALGVHFNIHLAYKERNGEVSIIKAKKAPYLVEVGVREGVQKIVIEIQGG